MNVLMLVMSDVAHDSRVMREAVALAEHGHAIHIVGKDVPVDWTPPRGITVESVSGGTGFKPQAATSQAATSQGTAVQGTAVQSTASQGAPSPAAPKAAASPSTSTAARRAVRWLLLPQHRQRVWRTWCTRAGAAVEGRKFDVVHAHDFNVLRLAAQLADQSGARLVYDSHEFWSGRERHGRPTPIERARERRAEQKLLRRADAVLTVSAGIAERLGGWRGGEVRLVRNTFPATPESEASKVPLKERPAGIVYAGRIGAARDLETLLPAAAAAHLDAVLMGPADREYLQRIQPAIDSGAVRLEPARPVDEVDDVLREVGISMVTLTDTCDNHRMALPNKLFHAVRAGVPVVAADLPELRRTVTAYGLGALYRPGDVASMRAALEQVAGQYPQLCAQVANARGDLSWERDAEVLVGVYADLAGRDVASAAAR
ncbi:MAG: glycosyltransferase [Actinocrinis sp.]